MSRGDNPVYIWQRRGWPDLTWDTAGLAASLADARHRQGRLLGRMETLGFGLRGEASIETLTRDVLKTSEIEGVALDARQVRSSIARRLRLRLAGLVPSDRQVDGVVEMTLDATGRFAAPLTRKRLFGWHRSLFAAAWAGAWRGGPMRVVSGRAGRPIVHFEAPPADRVEREMEAFLRWFNRTDETDPVIRSGVAHLWFVTIHPFEDGNGRVARAIADLSLARADGTSKRFYSVSAEIRRNRNDYYRELERAQKGAPDVTEWLRWYLGCLGRAVDGAEAALAGVMAKSRFWKRFKQPLNPRQVKMLNRLLDGHDTNATTSKWAKLTGTSQDSAYRDILDLTARGALRQNPGRGRRTSYSIVVS